jgi:hypothetical protein
MDYEKSSVQFIAVHCGCFVCGLCFIRDILDGLRERAFARDFSCGRDRSPSEQGRRPGYAGPIYYRAK